MQIAHGRRAVCTAAKDLTWQTSARDVPPLLLVEDEFDDEQFVQRALEAHRVINPLHVVRDVESAQKYLRRDPRRLPALIIVDLYLPGRLNGLDLLDWIRKQPSPLSQMPAIVLTVSTDQTHEMRASAAAAALFLFKPITPAVLIDAFRNIEVVVTRTVSRPKSGMLIEPRSASEPR